MLGWTNVSKSFSIIGIITDHTILLVYRVNWLKAKARWRRWEEELSLVQHEMGWTVAWFKHQQGEWYRRWNEATKPGHQAYAYRQMMIWKTFAEDAEDKFCHKRL